MFRNLFILILSIALLASCRSTRQIQTVVKPKKDTVTQVVVTPVVSSHEDTLQFLSATYQKIAAHQIDFSTFSAKIDVDYTDAQGKKYNVNAHLRMQKDSAIWISITAIFGIEGLRALITPDSVKLINKQDKVYTARSVAYLQEVTALPLDLSSLQQLLIGNPVFLDSSRLTSYSQNDAAITLISLGEFFKNLVTVDKTTELIQSSKLDDLDGSRNRTCFLNYSDYEISDGVTFATKRHITVAEAKKLDIRLDFKQFAFNETLSFPFSVPKSYKAN